MNRFVDFKKGFCEILIHFKGQGQRLEVKYLECIGPIEVSQLMTNVL